jgi:hypothetical protein
MDKNRITGRTSEQVIAKSTVIKGRGGKSGGCAAMARLLRLLPDPVGVALT